MYIREEYKNASGTANSRLYRTPRTLLLCKCFNMYFVSGEFPQSSNFILLTYL